MVFIFKSRCQPGLWSSEGLARVGGSARVGMGGVLVPCQVCLSTRCLCLSQNGSWILPEWVIQESCKSEAEVSFMTCLPKTSSFLQCSDCTSQYYSTAGDRDPWRQCGRLAATGPAQGLPAGGLGLESRARSFPVCFSPFISFTLNDKICIFL